MNLTTSASQAVNAPGATFWEYAPYLVLVALVLVTGYFQQRQTMRNQTTPNPQMAMISKVFPIVFGFISWGIPSGVVLYFFTSNLWQIGQQEVVLRTIGTAASPVAPKKGARELETGSPPGAKSAVVDKPKSKRSRGDANSGNTGDPPTGGKSSKSGSDASAGKSAGRAGGTSNGNGQAQAPNRARSNRKRKR